MADPEGEEGEIVGEGSVAVLLVQLSKTDGTIARTVPPSKNF